MKTNWIICLLGGMWLASCSPDDPAPNEDVNALYQQFHGKYKAVSSVSSEAIDVNLDGLASTDMLAEIPDLTLQNSNYLELRIYGPGKLREGNAFILTQWWPEQDIRTKANKLWNGEPIDYDPHLSVYYAMQGSPRYFSFSTDLMQILVRPSENENPFRWQRPESVTVEGAGRMRVVNKRRLYTRAGVKEVTITTVYVR